MIASGTVRLGAAIWTAIRPWRRLKVARNKRRARLGKPLLPLNDGDFDMLPKGSMTHTGSGIAAFGPVIMIGLQIVGVGTECSQEAIEMGCVTAAEVTGALVTLGGAVLAIVGRIRAARSHAAELAAAKAPPQQ